MKNTLVTLLLAMGFIHSILAQNSLYFMDNLPQTIYQNPASIPKIKSYFNMPFISHIQGEFHNSGFNLNQFNEFKDQLGRQNYDPDEFIRSIGENNFSRAETRMNFLDFGFSLKGKGYFSVSLSHRILLELQAPTNILYLLNDYETFKNKLPMDISGLDVHFNSFSQLAVAFSKTFGEKLTLGVSPKITGAMFGLQSNHIDVRLDRAFIADEYKDYYESKQRFSGQAMIGLPVQINKTAINTKGEFDPDKDILPEDWTFRDFKLFENPGFVFDLGMNYDLNEYWSFSASLIDVGHTRWTNNGYLFDLQDSIYKITKDTPVKLPIPTKVYLAGNYKFSPNWNTGLLVRNTIYNAESFSSATLSLNGYVFRMLSTSVSYTAAHTYNNIGAGIRLRLLPIMDFYAVTDNLLQIIHYKEAQHASIAFGINFSKGIKREKNVTPEMNL